LWVKNSKNQAIVGQAYMILKVFGIRQGIVVSRKTEITQIPYLVESIITNILWFYQPPKNKKKPENSGFFLINLLTAIYI
jgi:hypothetical protein